jgi:AraC-like DNA-binding protein/mannose-6-phosphate isomerase-like protein (cupin superfamily)
VRKPIAVHTLRKKEGFQGQKAIVIPRKILSTQCAQNPVIAGMFITDIGYYPKAKFHYRERPHGSDQHIFIYCLEGRGEVTIKKHKYSIEAGEFFIVPPKTAHTYAADEIVPWTIYWIHFKGKTADAINELLRQKYNGHKGFKQYDEKTIRLFNEMYNQLERGYSMDHLLYSNMCLFHFFATFIYTSTYTETGELNHKDIHDLAIDFLSKNLDKTLTLEEIAASVNLSASHFSFVFKQKTGFTPIEYFNHLKVQKACQYLLFTSLRIKEIAVELGIEDQFYFSRMFTKLMGISPNEYRERRIH